jgi:DNA modification methylase
MMVPARLAIALQDDGWWLRSDCIWAKPNPMPESVTDRPTSAHEHIFLLTKSARYFYDQDAVRSPHTEASIERNRAGFVTDQTKYDKVNPTTSVGNLRNGSNALHEAGANLRNVWEIATQPFSGAHFATFPLEIPRRCIKAGTSEKGACSACGAPWVRVVERMVNGQRHVSPKDNNPDRNDGGDVSSSRLHSQYFDYRTETTGWQPGCTCDADVMPCTILDPFLGSGTTLLVADQLGRNGIGVELSPAYAEMAKQRITGDAPMFAEVEIDAA